MKTWTISFGVSALIFAVADLVHGQHNGDVHRFYIHIAEFLSFVCFLGLLEILAFRKAMERFGLDRWLAGFCISIVSFLAGFALFGISGGSAHGDGGPLAVGFALTGCLGLIGIPVSIVGFIVTITMRKRKGSLAP